MADDTMLEEQIGQWRLYLSRRRALADGDIAELEDHLREQVADLRVRGLWPEEAFLVAVRRMGALDALSQEFAREHSERLWKQMVAGPAAAGGVVEKGAIAILLAVAAALAVKLPVLFGLTIKDHPGFYFRNAAFFVLPLLTVYFAWKRRPAPRLLFALGITFAAACLFANLYAFAPRGQTEALTALHLPMLLWLAAGVAYAARRWNDIAGRMDFIRFSGEFFIYYVLIALGGGVFMGFTAMIFRAASLDPSNLLAEWVAPCGAAGAVLIAAWLVQAKQSVIENMAPVLARLFTPLFTALLLLFLATLLVTWRGIVIERNVLIGFDLLLALVLGLLLYALSARDPAAPPGLFDRLQVLLVASALAVDAVALWAIAARIDSFGFTPNRVAALGENIILLVNLSWTAVLYVRFLRGGSVPALERWQTAYLPVYAAWAALVVIVFPPLFHGL